MADMPLFRNRRYRLLYGSASMSNLGDGILLLVLPWLASLVSRDAQQIAWVTAALRLPWLFFSLPAGVAADRCDRRLLMLAADCMRLLFLAALVFYLWGQPELSTLSSWQASVTMLLLTLAAFALGSAEVLRDNTAQTLLPAVVNTDQLEKANGQMWSAEQLMGQFIGPPIAGYLIVLSVEGSLVAAMLCVAAAMACLYRLQLPHRQAVSTDTAVLQHMLEGLRWLYQHTVLLRLALMLGVINFVATGAVTMLVLFSQEVLGLSAAEHGLLLTAGAVGGVAGGFLCPGIIARIGSEASLRVAMFLFAMPFAVIAVSDQVVWVALALFLEMFAALLWNIVTVSLRQRLIPDQLLGRVNSVYRLLGWGAMPLGALAAGYLVSVAELYVSREQALRSPYVVATVLSLLLFCYGVARLRLPEQQTAAR